MANLSKPKVEVVPVAWANENIMTKYQAKATLIRPNGDVKVLTGDPKSTQEGALNSLKAEVIQRQDDLSRIVEVLNSYVI